MTELQKSRKRVSLPPAQCRQISTAFESTGLIGLTSGCGGQTSAAPLMFASVSGRATMRSNIGLFPRNGPGFREASN